MIDGELRLGFAGNLLARHFKQKGPTFGARAPCPRPVLLGGRTTSGYQRLVFARCAC